MIQVLEEYWRLSIGADAEAHAVVKTYCAAAQVINPPSDRKPGPSGRKGWDGAIKAIPGIERRRI